MLKYISTTTETERERGKNTISERDLSIAYKICLKTPTNRATILRVRKRGRTPRSATEQYGSELRGRKVCSPATTIRNSATRQQETEEKAERKRASASSRMGKRGRDGEHITRRDGGKETAVTLAFPHAPPHLPPARAEQNFLAAIARPRSSRAWLPRNGAHGRFSRCRWRGQNCMTGARPWTASRQPIAAGLHPGSLVRSYAPNQTRPQVLFLVFLVAQRTL